MSTLIWEDSWTFCLKKKTLLVRKKLQAFILSSLLRDSIQTSFFYHAVIGNCMFATFSDKFFGVIAHFWGWLLLLCGIVEFCNKLALRISVFSVCPYESKCTVHIMGFLERSTMDTEIIKLSNFNEVFKGMTKTWRSYRVESVIIRIINANKRVLL